MSDRIGQLFGNYQLIQLLGRGGFADVYLSEHIHLNTQAAIKVLSGRLRPEDLYTFKLEAKTIAQLTHPHILRILDFGDEQGIPYLVMEYAEKGTLRDRHPRKTILPVSTVLDYVKQLTSALQYAHNHKVIHRDIKPDNMLVDKNNTVFLSDFGIALMGHTSHRYRTEGIAGTAAYMAPEQFQGQPRRASDQYSLGIVVYEWLCGDLPFHGNFYELASQHMLTPPPSLQQQVPDISSAVEQVVFTALAKDPEHRFQNVEEFALSFKQAVQRSATVISPPKKAVDPRRFQQNPFSPSPVHVKTRLPSSQVQIPPHQYTLPQVSQPLPATSTQFGPRRKVNWRWVVGTLLALPVLVLASISLSHILSLGSAAPLSVTLVFSGLSIFACVIDFFVALADERYLDFIFDIITIMILVSLFLCPHAFIPVPLVLTLVLLVVYAVLDIVVIVHPDFPYFNDGSKPVSFANLIYVSLFICSLAF